MLENEGGEDDKSHLMSDLRDKTENGEKCDNDEDLEEMSQEQENR